MYKSSMKRDRDRDSSPVMTERSRSSMGRSYNDDSSDGGTPPDRRRRAAEHSPPRRGGGGYNDDYGRGGSSGYRDTGSSSNSSRTFPYKVLCISSLHGKASDEVIRETLYREFKRFGDISVKVVQEPDERVAYVYFRTYEDARDAKHSKSRIIIYDKPVMVEAAYESVPTGSSSGGGGGGSRYDYNSVSGSGGDRGGYYRRSPMYEPRGHRDEHHEGHRGGGRNYEGTARSGGYGHHPPPLHRGPYPLDVGYNRREPPLHHYDHHGGGHMGGGHSRGMGYNRYPNGPSGGLPRQPGERVYENKKDKFPNYLHHIAPEDDPLATRTLFAGNLEVNIPEDELRKIFGRFRTVEDIDIKRPPPGTGNAYAFVRFVNLDMAAKAKTELSGQYIGKFQCKIGYGKANPTNKIWVGGLGPISWQGSLILKNSSFPTKMNLTSGDLDAVESIMKDKDKNQLQITQRLRLEQAKLDDVLKRITQTTAHGIFLAMPASVSSPQGTENGGSNVQSRPLRNLVTYLKQKEAAGIIMVKKTGDDTTGVLYVFAPNAFSSDLLARGCPGLDSDIRDDHLVVAVIRGPAAS